MDSINIAEPQDINNQDDDACLDALLLSQYLVFPMMFKAALDLKVFDIIAREGPAGTHGVSAWCIAAQLPTKDPEAAAPRLDRMLRLLASHSVLTCTMQTLEDGKVERLYGLTAVGKLFAGGESGASLTSLAALASHKATIDVWLHAKDTILESGNQFEKVHGMSLFEYMDKDPKFNNIFNTAMDELSTISMKKVVEIYNGFEGLKSLVDVGGGSGKCLNMIISKYPSIKGINFDLPHVTKTAPSYPGIEHVGGDMFSFIPKANAIMIKDVLHNWSDEYCMKLLKKCHEALPNNGKVIVISFLMLEVPDSSMASMYVSRLDNTMLMHQKGKERTEKEFEALAKGSGFSYFRVVCLAHSIWAVMEFIK